MKRKTKWILGILTIFFISFLSAILLLYVQRDRILNAYVSDKVRKVEEQYTVCIEYEKMSLNGLTKIEINDFYVKSEKTDTLFYARKLNAEVNFWKFLKKKLELKDLRINGVVVKLPDERNEIMNLLARKNKEKKESTDSSYNKKLSRSINFFFRIFPENIHISDMRMETGKTIFYLPEVVVENNVFHIPVSLTENNKKQHFIVDGLWRKRDRRLECKVYSSTEGQVEVPYLRDKYDTELAFDTLIFNFYPLHDGNKKLQLGGELSFFNMNIKNDRLSTKTIHFHNSRIDYILSVFRDHIELDSTSLIQFNKLNFHPYLSFSKRPEPKLTVSVRKDDLAADDLFSSFPEGLFQNLEGIKASGNLSLDFAFSVDMANVDSLYFHSSLDKKNFKIEKFGNSDFREIREPFEYTAYENGKEVKTFMVGESYEHFRSLDRISPYLIAAVLFAEDGHFYSHKGFVEDALKSSIIKNIKEKRFARGGSTISMQLVKNLYLNRNKTLMRKMEEALIVWLIENNALVSKSRMLEVYLNIIEWGPMVYGANEASRFYFSKDAADLTPAEAIFMASIVSRPKKFMWFFDNNRNLKPFLSHFYDVVGKRMVKHGYITEEQFEEMVPNVEIRGEASVFLPKVESSQLDEDTDWDIYDVDE
jgi:hypothetical protein